MDVRSSCRRVADNANYVTINSQGIERIADEVNGILPEVQWDFEGIHFFDGGPLTAQYMLVLDALNFCFWPDKELHYEHLARGLKRTLEEDLTAFDAQRLQKYSGSMLRELLQWPRELPLEEERARLLREEMTKALLTSITAEFINRIGVGRVLEDDFGGLAVNLVAAAKGSALNLVELVAGHFPGFRDHSIYKGQQVFIYKRAQIFVADLWGAFKGKGIGEFKDIGCITMFADYVVPAVLRHWGILEYSRALADIIDSQKEIASGSQQEVELRACTITAVERLRETLTRRNGQEVTSVQIDWWLWSSGMSSIEAPKFHHTLTVYY